MMSDLQKSIQAFTRAERYSAHEVEQVQTPKHFKDYILREEPQDEAAIIYIHGVPILSIGNVLLVSGPPKSGKTRLVSTLVNQSGLRAAYIDSEQGRKHSWLLGRRIPLADIYHMRGADQNEIMRVVDEVIKCAEYNLLVIDNCRDLLLDFNNVEQSGELELFLKRASESIPTIAVLHENKTSSRSQGHLGYSFEKISQTVARVTLIDPENPSKGSSVECTLSRDEPFPKALLSIDCRLYNDNLLKVGGNSLTQDELFTLIGGCEYSYDELVSKIAEIFCVSIGTAKNSFTALRKACPGMFKEVKEGKRKMFFVSLPS